MIRYTVHPSVDIDRDKPRLKVLTNFTPDYSLPKYSLDDGKVRGPNGKSMSLDDYLKSTDRMRRYSRAMSNTSSYWREGSRFKAFLMKLRQLVTGGSRKDNPLKTMETVKDLIHRKILTTNEADIIARIDTMVKTLNSQGQYDLANGLMQSYPVVKAEATLMKLGYKLYLTEEDILEVFKKARYGVRLDFLANYTDILPPEIGEKKRKLDEEKIFDNYVVLHYDPAGKSLAVIQERAAKADPILFGMIANSDRLYFVADWVTKDDDITLEKLARDIGTKPSTITRGIGNGRNDILDSIMSIEQVVPDDGLDEPMQSGDTESGGF